MCNHEGAHAVCYFHTVKAFQQLHPTALESLPCESCVGVQTERDCTIVTLVLFLETMRGHN